nr:unnamed protein product [Spirometra erinaceieuropaei]
MSDEQLPERLFYGDVAMGASRQGSQTSRYMDTQINAQSAYKPNRNRRSPPRDRSAWRRVMKIGATVYEANRLFAVGTRGAIHKSQASQIHNANSRPLPTCPHFQRIFHAQITHDGHFRTQYNYNSAIPTAVSTTAPIVTPTVTFTAPATTTSLTTNDHTPDAPLSPISSIISATNPPMTATTTNSPMNAIGDNTPTASSTAIPTNSYEDSVPTCPYCGHAFTPRIGLISHMSMRNSEIHRNIGTPSIPCPSNNSPIPNPVDSPPTSATTISITATPTDSTSPTLPYRRMCTSRAGLVGHFRIHRPKTDRLVPGAPTYAHRHSLSCS